MRTIVTHVAKPAEKQSKIVDHLLGQILRGQLPPGDRIPTMDELGRRFGGSRQTLRFALQRLSDDGFIIARGKRGTFVTENPPHLRNYGLVLPPRQSSAWSHYCTAFVNEAGRLKDASQRVPVYQALEGTANLADYNRLISDVGNHRLGALIFPQPPFGLEGTTAVDGDDGIARIYISITWRNGLSVRFDFDGWNHKVLSHLAKMGRRRVAFINTVLPWRKLHEEYQRLSTVIAPYGLTTRPQWVHVVSLTAPQWVAPLIALLMDRHTRHRPDALVIMDDNLVEHTTAGLADAGVRVPEDMAVVGHANFPWPTPSAMPITRIGFSVKQALQTAIRLVGDQRQGKETPPITWLPAYLEDDVPGSGTERG